jgi:hypothetical protein
LQYIAGPVNPGFRQVLDSRAVLVNDMSDLRRTVRIQAGAPMARIVRAVRLDDADSLNCDAAAE